MIREIKSELSSLKEKVSTDEERWLTSAREVVRSVEAGVADDINQAEPAGDLAQTAKKMIQGHLASECASDKDMYSTSGNDRRYTRGAGRSRIYQWATQVESST